MLAVLQPPAVSEKCVSDAVSNLAGCAIDNSLAYSAGCCSKECAANLLKVSGAAWAGSVAAAGQQAGSRHRDTAPGSYLLGRAATGRQPAATDRTA
jgi:hypothetical protein